MRCPQDDCAGRRNNASFPHLCNVLRPTLAFQNGVDTDLKISGWTEVLSDQPCWFEHVGTRIVQEDPRMGRVAVAVYAVWFGGHVGITMADRLVRDGKTYVVEDIADNSDEGFMFRVGVREMNFSQV